MKLKNLYLLAITSLFCSNAALAQVDPNTISEAVREFEGNFHPLKIFYAIALTFLFFLILFTYNKINPSLSRFINNLCDKYVSSIKYKDLEILKGSVISEILKILFKVINIAIFFGLFYFYLLVVFSIFPATQGIASALLSYVLGFLHFIYKSVISFIPNVFAILVIIALTFSILNFLRFFVWAMWTQKLSFYGFHREWIYPTYNIVRFFVVVFALVMIAPYLPGFESPSFKAVSVLLGIMVTMGSTSAIANVIAGIVLIYMRPFNVGDRVKIDDVVGDVVEMSLLVTRVKTTKNEFVTLPNSKVLGGSMVDYSSPAEKKELILYTSITIGYDTPIKKVRELLLEAAGIEGALKEPKPFVLIKGLENSYINYEINIYVDNAKNMPKLYSALNENIYNCFDAAGVEILSAEYYALRDGNERTLSDKTTHEIAGFKIAQ